MKAMLASQPLPLKNSQNSCYVNAILQTLFHCDKFNQSLQKHILIKPETDKLSNTNNHDQPLFSHIYKLMYICFVNKNTNLLNNLIKQFRNMTFKSNPYNTTTITNTANTTLNTTLFQQQDAHEALSLILKTIHQELIPITPKYNFATFHHHIHHSNKNQFDEYLRKQYDTLYQSDYSIVSKYFSFQTVNVIECNICKHKPIKIEKNEQLILSINNSDTIETALNEYFAPEIVPYNKKCSNCCNKDCGITIYTFLLGVPTYLVIVLNRFNIDKKTLKCFKNSKYIDYNDRLCVSPYLLKTSINIEYSLQSIINHKGQMDNGHYYCYQNYNNVWYKCNDEHINKLPNNKLGKHDKDNTYILIYELINDDK